MSLGNAHEGYEYQDLLTCYFILDEILSENDSSFIIDRKDYDKDKMDDLQVINPKKQFKKQIKYSNTDNNHTLSKSDLSADSAYQLSLDTLYDSWLLNPKKDETEFRICLAWQPPEDELLDVLEVQQDIGSFPRTGTEVYKIDGRKLWPENSMPLKSWRRLRKAAEQIDRVKFMEFCDHLLIEVLMPKFSMSLTMPGDLETLVLEQARNLGIGIFPNHNLSPENFILNLTAIIKRSRSKGISITTAGLFHELAIKTDFGSIAQEFPVIETENVKRLSAVEQFLTDSSASSKILLVDEPGGGKSWFLENLSVHLKKKDVKVVRHYCYTSLDDVDQRERIKTNVFYGNLISDIISVFPELKRFKRQKYASSLNELNQLLANIENPTYVIVDGLDHIERVATFREISDVNKQERAIIESIAQLNISPFVTILVASQNIPELEKFTEFERHSLPRWSESDIKKLLAKSGTKNPVLKKGYSLSKFLLEKSKGNPLYLKYLIDEIKKSNAIRLDDLHHLPEYAFNLKTYYAYLLSQLNTREDVPRVLSGVSFSLTKTELEEITYGGDQVNESIAILSPVLKLNLSQSGYSIYHESFRRFIVDDLKSRAVSVDQKVFRPVRDWFETKDFFGYQKSYRYFLQFLYEGGAFGEVLSRLHYTFVTDSILNGQSWDTIEKNFKLFVKAACCVGDFPKIVLLNEIGKIIGSCKEEFSELFELYIDTLGKIYGYNRVASYLQFEGLPTVPLLDGLKACLVCDQNLAVPPWHLYMTYFDSGKVQASEMPYYIRGLLCLRNGKRLNRTASKLKKVSENYTQLFIKELNKYSNKEYIRELTQEYPAIMSLLEKKAKPYNVSLSIQDLTNLADKIVKFDNVFVEETQQIIDFFTAVKAYLRDESTIKMLLKKFSGKNWFYNWLSYYLQILTIEVSAPSNYPMIKRAFDLLKYNLNPFEGNPRTCDLYSLQPFIYKTIQQGLKMLQSEGQWKETVETLVLVSRRTTTTLQRTLNGPIATDKLFQLLSDSVCEENVNVIIETLKQLEEENQDDNLHSDIAGYNLRLAAVAAASSDKTLAKQYFTKGTEFALAYTMRKDSTLMDCLEGVAHYAKTNPENALKDLKQVRILAESTVFHTDGKGTSHFPIDWFKSFLKIDVTKAMLYLADDLLGARYHWWVEDCLGNLLITLNGTLNPEIEAYIALTFPISDSEQFVSYCVRLCDLLRIKNPVLRSQLLAWIIPAMRPKQNRYRSEELKMRFNQLIIEENYSPNYYAKAASENKILPNQPWYITGVSNRKGFSEMAKEELITHFETQDIPDKDLIALACLFDSLGTLDGFVKQLISTIVNKNNRRYPTKANLDQVFATGNEFECYYWVCRFVSDQGGWMEMFINQNAFQKAYAINPEKANAFLFELMPDQLEVGYNSLFSSNLLQMLTSANAGKDMIESVWNHMLTVTSYRLPFQDDIKWDELLDNEADMTPEEILSCILIARFKTETTERFARTATSLANIMSDTPEKLVKPFQWFLKNRSRFLKAPEIAILQLIYKQSGLDDAYSSNFRSELIKGFPSGYFLTDYIIGQLYNLNGRSIFPPMGLTYPDISKGLFNFFCYMNGRNRILKMEGLDLDHVFSKYAATYNEEYKDHFELYGNRMYKTIVPHIYGGEHMLEIINRDCYEHLCEWADFLPPNNVTFATFIDLGAIALNTNGQGLRPADLVKPFELTQTVTFSNDFGQEWIRLGHYECAASKESFKINEFESFGAIVFSRDIIYPSPYANYTVFPAQLYSGVGPKIKIEDRNVIAILQRDPIETFNIIWLNPELIKILGLTVHCTNEGMLAVNDLGQITLKMRTWRADYVGEGYHATISDEIPLSVGTELIIRKDYFERLRKMFSHQPKYMITKKPPSA